MDSDAARYVATLREIRDGIRHDDVAMARDFIASIVSRIELLSESAAPDPKHSRRRRRIKEIRIHYRPAEEIIACKIALPIDYHKLLCHGK